MVRTVQRAHSACRAAAPSTRKRPLILKAARGVYEYFWMYLGLLYIGIVGLVFSFFCSVIHLALRGSPRPMGTRRITGVVLRIFFRALMASGVLRVDLSAL